MKKKFLICLCICSLIAASESAFAAVSATTPSTTSGIATSGQALTSAGAPGGTLTLGVTTALTYNPSPSVLMAVKASTSAYAIMATNAVTDATNGMEYGTKSSATGYAQRTKTVAAATAVPVPASETALATAVTGKAWVWMGGSGS